MGTRIEDQRTGSLGDHEKTLYLSSEHSLEFRLPDTESRKNMSTRLKNQ